MAAAAIADSGKAPKPAVSAPKKAGVAKVRPTGCPGSRAAIRYYRAAYTEHRLSMDLPAAPPFVRERCETTRTRAGEWRAKAYQARVALHAWVEYQFAWLKWLPANWHAVARCETHVNWHHSNSSFVSAFGISRSIYDSDAAYMGAPPWSDTHPPTPRQQYLAALGHYKRFGDGWGCPGP